jgi:hypothetical protein
MRTAILRTLVCYAAPFSVACSAAEGDSLEPNGDDVAVSQEALLPTPVTIRFDSGGADRAAVVASDGTGGVLVGGSIPHPQFNSFGVAKFDAQGQLVWRSNPVFGGTTGLVTAIAVRDDLNIYVAGDIVTSSGTETVVVGMRDGGFPLWEQRFPKNGFATGIEFIPPFDDVVVMNNELTVLSAFNGAVFARLPQGPNNAPFVGVDMVRDRQGRIIVTGNSQGNVVTNKYDFQFGNGRLFSHTFTQTSTLMVRDLAVDSTGNVYFTGTTAPTAGQFGTPFAVRLDTNGVLRSSRFDVGGASVAVDATDNVVFGTDSRVTAPSLSRVTKFNAAGAQVWSTALPNAAGAERSVISSRTGEIFVNHRFDTTQLDAAGNVTGQHTNNRYFANDMKLDAFNNLFLSLDTLTFGPGVAGTGDNDLVALKFVSGITTPPQPQPQPPPAPPAAPSNLTASGGRRSITLTWADRSFDETRFEIHRCPGSTCNPTSYVGISGNTTSFTDSAGRNQTFRYKVRACNDFNGFCSAFSNTATGRSSRF